MKKYLLSEADRRELMTVLQAQRKGPPPRNIARPVVRDTQEGDTYWVIPPCEQGLPAAEMVDGVPVPIGVQSCLYRHSWRSTELEAMVGPTGLPLRVPVYNYFPRAENNLTQVYKQKDGTWTNARPEEYDNAPRAGTGTTQPPENPAPDPNCSGDCKWVADSNGVWQGPTGGCTDASGTSTTTGTTTTAAPTTTGAATTPDGGSYSTHLPNPSTLPPCSASRCSLVCGQVTQTGTTVYPRYIYALATGTGTATTGCPTGCSCYGIGDPCWLDGGELLSHCIGSAPTSAPTTTIDPHAAACDLALAIFGPPIGEIYRAAVHGGVAETWTACELCNTGRTPLFPLGGEEFRNSDRPDLVTVYESMCVSSPCEIYVAPSVPGRAVFQAYPYETQLFRWPGAGQYLHNDEANGRFRANWFACSPCNGRNAVPPPYWIYSSAALNAAQDVVYDEAAGVYVFEVDCVDGIPCDACGRAPYVATPTTISPPTTTGTGTTTSTGAPTTTTPAPCSCERPDYCGLPGECVYTRCSRGGAAVTLNPNLHCEPLSTTVPPVTLGPGTTLSPTQCIDSVGTICNCGGVATTSYPVGGRCPPGYYLVPAPSNCDFPYCVPMGSPPPITSGPPRNCTGYCVFRSAAVALGPPAEYVWILEAEACSLSTNCACRRPVQPATECDQIKVTNCISGPAASTPPPCDCCGNPTTTPQPVCSVGKCRYEGNGSGGWTRTINTCPTGTACPCASAARIEISSSEACDGFTLACGQEPPTTTTGTTTPSPLGACCAPSLPCAVVSEAVCQARGGLWAEGATCDTCYGACCLDGGGCGVVFQSDCLSPNSWQGIGSRCGDGGICSTGTTAAPTTTTTGTTGTGTTAAPLGACCSGQYPCVDGVTEEYCDQDSWHEGQSCLALAYCQGACCIGFTCYRTNESACSIFGGTYLGDAASCDGDPCAPTTTTTVPPTTTPPGP